MNLKLTVIDVRTPGEFAGGHVADAINIPLNELPSQLDRIKQMTGTIILCCASGARSNTALHILKQNGVENILDGGPWTNVNYQLNNKN
ncbi:MAG: rhodanese-like domain-containing protein [Bacteroidetes bacterium]|nr:rhodanese-like domain-containing protein [Bacteroidota bacterium]